MPIEILITDVTEMHGGNYCVAGWSTRQRRMIRPLPDGRNWTAELLTRYRVQPGGYLAMTPTGEESRGLYPHRTEDLVVQLSSISAADGPRPEWFGETAPAAEYTVADAFDHRAQHTSMWGGALKGIHVAEGAQTRSLSAVVIACRGLTFFEDDFRGRKSLRAILDDGRARYNLPVSSAALRELYRTSGVATLMERLPNRGNLHVRLGLARAWSGQPDKCFVMINGVFW
jgi:hypothetical protein